MPSLARVAVVAFVAVLLGTQLIRPARTNPPTDPSRTITARMRVTPEVAAVLKRACRDCHSNETTWPWYSNVAPISWLVIDHVRSGRRHFNYSEWAEVRARQGAQAAAGDLRGDARRVDAGRLLHARTPRRAPQRRRRAGALQLDRGGGDGRRRAPLTDGTQREAGSGQRKLAAGTGKLVALSHAHFSHRDQHRRAPRRSIQSCRRSRRARLPVRGGGRRRGSGNRREGERSGAGAAGARAAGHASRRSRIVAGAGCLGNGVPAVSRRLPGDERGVPRVLAARAPHSHHRHRGSHPSGRARRDLHGGGLEWNRTRGGPSARLASGDEPLQLRHPDRRHAVPFGDRVEKRTGQCSRPGGRCRSDPRRARQRRRAPRGCGHDARERGQRARVPAGGGGFRADERRVSEVLHRRTRRCGRRSAPGSPRRPTWSR